MYGAYSQRGGGRDNTTYTLRMRVRILAIVIGARVTCKLWPD